VNLESANRWLTLTANVGVLIGLIFLVLEINQNTEVARSAVDLELATMSTEFHMRVAENPDLARAYYMILHDPESLTEDQKIQLYFLIPGVFLLMEGAHRQYVRGYLPKSGWTPYEGLISYLLRSPIVRDWWIDGPTVFTKDFETAVEEISGVHRGAK
jgi:hypothetical protein